MKSRLVQMLGALALLGAGSTANALSVSLLATSPVFVLVGDTVTVDVVMDFSSEPTLGGGFNIYYDSSALAVTGFVSNDIGSFDNRDPDLLDGVLQSWIFADFNGLAGPLTVGTVTFEVISATDSVIDIEDDLDGIGGSFVSAVTFDPYLPGQVDFSGDLNVTVQTAVFPIPAAAWFMLSGLGALVGLRRRAT